MYQRQIHRRICNLSPKMDETDVRKIKRVKFRVKNLLTRRFDLLNITAVISQICRINFETFICNLSSTIAFQKNSIFFRMFENTT